uniref:Uncharacterized protein n=1 Tax=Rhizophora mucronata TaxID=61149 RepID=A0A2P2NCC1_RHIMU
MQSFLTKILSWGATLGTNRYRSVVKIVIWCRDFMFLI